MWHETRAKYTDADVITALEAVKLYFSGGNVGIDNSTPETVFSVNGKMQIISTGNASLALKPTGGVREFRFGCSHASGEFFIYDKTNSANRFKIEAGGRVLISGDTFGIQTAKTPAGAGAAGDQGDFCWDASYVYLCRATNTWDRIPHAWDNNLYQDADVTKLAGIDAGADVTGSNPPQAHGASVHTDRTRTMFIPTPTYSTADSGGSGTLFDPSTVEKAVYMFRLPTDFSTLTSIKMVWNILTWETSEKHIILDFSAKFGSNGQNYEIHSNVDGDRDITVPAFDVATIHEHTILSSLFTDITIDDYVRLTVERDADHVSDTHAQDLNVFGILIEYTADM